MIESYIEELKQIRAAILKLTADPTTSQSVSSANGGSFSASYVDLGRLHRREAELCSLIADLHRGGALDISYQIYC